MNIITNKNIFSEHIASMAINAMLYEVSATPKPGLVDRNNNGAHLDMDFYSFMSSSISQYTTFKQATQIGMEEELATILNKLRPIGIRGECQMFEATGGINTHKGLIFSLGIIAASAGYLFENNKSMTVEDICYVSAAITKGICEEELYNMTPKNKLSSGEKLFIKHKTLGIRGEAESGFQTIKEIAMPIFKEQIEKYKANINEAMIYTLIHIMAKVEDSNIMTRAGQEGLKYAQKKAGDIISNHDTYDKEFEKEVEKLDNDFINKNISPGGAADILAITVMMNMICK